VGGDAVELGVASACGVIEKLDKASPSGDVSSFFLSSFALSYSI
jgi:hypothetical protein